MKKYLRLACTSCKREIDKSVDLTHYTPDQCTITQGCEGRLQIVEYRSSAGIAVAPQIGVVDWRQRGSSTTTNKAPTETALVNLATGSLKQLVLAVPTASEPPINAVHTLTLAVKADTPKAYRQYIFRKEGAFTTIAGVESGLEKKALRFSAADSVQVFVNGVEREQGTDEEDFQIYKDGSSLAPPNTILFNTAIDQSGITQVDVIVSKEVSASTITLTFKRNKPDESRANLGAYENVSYVDRLVEEKWQRYYLFTYDLDDVTIPLNSILISQADTDELLLLARRPYTQLDRYTNLVLPLRDMSPERDYIKYFAEDTITTARATETSIVPIFPPLRVGKFNVEKTIKTANSGVEEQLIVNSRVVTGPDA